MSFTVDKVTYVFFTVLEIVYVMSTVFFFSSNVENVRDTREFHCRACDHSVVACLFFLLFVSHMFICIYPNAAVVLHMFKTN